MKKKNYNMYWRKKKKIKIKQKSKKEMKKTYRGGSKMCFILS